jgi:hypothetical protein
MSLFKRLLVVLGLVLPILVLSTPQFANAVNVIDPVCNQDNIRSLPPEEQPAVCKDNNPGGENPIVGKNGVLTRAIQIIAVIVGIASVFSMVISGFRMITSGGDGGKVASARTGVIYSLVGLVVAASAQIIVSFVLSRLGT